MKLNIKNAISIFNKEELEIKLYRGKPLLIKAGFDPTRPDLHFGHLVLLQQLRRFQEDGHEVVFIIGSFTAMLGDPTGRNELRPKLTLEEVKAAAKTYQEQANKILIPRLTHYRYNSTWFDKFTAADLLELASKCTLARILVREDFRNRYEQETPIYLHEMIYPLLQGWDSVQIAKEFGRCDIEVGGSDQLFNLCVGKELMKREGYESQTVIVFPLLEGTDAKFDNGNVVGQKMSKSLNNYISITDTPFDMLQKIMLVKDEVIWRYIELLSNGHSAALKSLVETGLKGINSIKLNFAQEMISLLHDDPEAFNKAYAERKAITEGNPPENTPTFTIPKDGLGLLQAMVMAGMAESNSKASQLVKGKSVYLNGYLATDFLFKFNPTEVYLIKAGSKNKKFAFFYPEK